MGYIARTNGGADVLELRVGVLADIDVADQGNWRSVIDQLPAYDRLTHTLVESDLIVVGDDVQVQYMLVPLPTARRKLNLTDYAARMRWNRTQAGLTLPNGVRVKTDQASKDTVDQVIAMFDKGWVSEVRWKTGPNQYITIDLAMMTSIAQAMAVYEQACFAVEEQIASEIASDTITTKAQIDAYAWPS